MYKIPEILEKSSINNKGVNFYTEPNFGNFINSSYKFAILKDVANGVKGVASFNENKVTNTLIQDTLLTPPNSTYTDVIPSEAEGMVDQVDNLIIKQFVQQFYEMYMAPIGLKEVYNRLGAVSGTIKDLHSLYPNGLKGLLAADEQGSWRSNLNFSFKVDEGVKAADKATYSSLAFPPFISHEVTNINNLSQNIELPDTEEEYLKDSSFDMKNILFRKNEATYRLPAFKAVNDNIHLLQVFLNRCFGVESTYINEWDLSMYMQEGLCSFIERSNNVDETIRIPQFVTTLTYGLLDDAPIDTLQSKSNKNEIAEVDVDSIATFATLNMAVSTRYAIDNQPLGERANKRNYIINSYPYSTYWFPPASGELIDDFNMSNYIKTMFAYDINGNIFEENANKAYTPALFHGKDLSKSTQRFLKILNYNDDRDAILSGWNSTDEDGKRYLPLNDNTNQSFDSNAYSYLPFWKQFYYSGEDGLTDLDLYLQEVAASGKETSAIEVSKEIINTISSGNETFNSLREKANEKYNKIKYDSDNSSYNYEDVQPGSGSLDLNYTDWGFTILGITITIPGSRIIKMFLDRNNIANRAQSIAEKAGNVSANLGTDGDANTTASSTSASMALKTATAVKKLDNPIRLENEDGQTVEISEYAVDDKEELCSKKAIEDGVAEHSPFLYGGPHGKYFSPLTLEGYTQLNNRTLANVPTLDTYATFSGNVISNNVRSLEYSKNYKVDGSYIDTVVCLTPNEREALLTGNAPFGIKDLRPKTTRLVTYTSEKFTRDYFYDWKKTYQERFLWWVQTKQDPRYYKISKYTNGKLNKLIDYAYDYDTGTFEDQRHTSRLEDNASIQKDWSNIDFKLIPTCGWVEGFDSSNKDCSWDSNTTIKYIKQDEYLFRRNTEIDFKTGEYVYKPSRDKIETNNVKWMIVPDNIPSNPVYGTKDNKLTAFTTYNTSGTEWYDQLKNMYESGTRELSVTLPIKDISGNILELVCGIANIYKSKTFAYVQKLKANWAWVVIWQKTGRRWRWTYNKNTRPNWKRTWEWIQSPFRQKQVYYTYYWEKEEIDAYNMYFRPNKVLWALPTDKLLDLETSNIQYNSRKPESSNIIERYNVDNSFKFKHISADKNSDRCSPDLFPFTLDFINKYGKSSTNVSIPGTSTDNKTRNFNSLKLLHTKGLFCGNILDSYRSNGKVLSTDRIDYTYNTWKSTIEYVDTSAIKTEDDSKTNNSNVIDAVLGKYYEKEKEFIVRKEIKWIADIPTWVAAKQSEQKELTQILDNCQAYKAVQEFRESEKLKYMSWYTPKETVSVYIDTVKQQIAWLTQLRDYANLYLTDKLIYEVYESSVDNGIKSIIEYNYRGDVKTVNSEIIDYRGVGGYTESFTEDINYFDALAIVRRVFNTNKDDKNTIYELTNQRILRLQALQKFAENIEKDYNKNPSKNIHAFMRLVTNTKTYLDCTTTNGIFAEDVLFDNLGNYVDQLFEVNKDSTFNMLKNPAAILWAYLNVLYQVRKYWVNVRLNKRSGSYWQLRGMERVLTFLLAQSEAENQNNATNKVAVSTGENDLKAKQIAYVQPRTSFTNQINDSNISVVNTKAIYVKVDYLGTPEPQKSTKWDDSRQLYNGNEIVYVNEVYKYAIKPKNDLYYIMSNSITNNINNYTKLMSSVTTQIASKDYVVTTDDFSQVKILLQQSKILNDTDLDTLEKVINPTDQNLKVTEDSIKLKTNYNITSLQNIFIKFINELSSYKRNYYLNKIQSSLYAVYIKWLPQQVWSGLREDDTNGKWHIDDWQKEDSKGKERVVVDLYGQSHTSSEAISAGITFDVVAGLNANTILTNPTILRNSTLLEVLCSTVDKVDLWRVAIPEELNIPITLLEDNPILVPAFQVDTALNGLKTGSIVKSTRSVLAGVTTNIVSPILEASEDMLSINSLSALGKFSEVSEVGLDLDSLKA